MRSYPVLLTLITACWGSAFMFIELGLRDFEPGSMMALRALIAAIILCGLLAAQRGLAAAARDLAALGRHGVVIGVLRMVIPFLAIGWGQQYVDSGVAAIAIAAIPVFTVLLAIRFRPSERVSGLRAVGIAVGLGGVALVAGADPGGGWLAVAGTGAIAGAALSYGAAALYVQGHVRQTGGLVLATAAAVVGFTVLLPIGLLQLPSEVPSLGSFAAVVTLALVGTVCGVLLLFRLIALFGSTRANLATYLLPGAALVYGAVFLDEEITLAKLGGLALVLGGVALGSGALGRRRIAQPQPAAAPVAASAPAPSPKASASSS